MRRFLRIMIATLSAFVAAGDARAQDGPAPEDLVTTWTGGDDRLSVRAKITPMRAPITETFTLTLELTITADGVRVSPPDLNASLPTGWNARELEVGTTLGGIWRYELEPFLPGVAEIAGIEIDAVVNGNESEIAMLTSPLRVEVTSVLGDEANAFADPAAIKGVRDPRFALTAEQWQWALLLSALFVACVWALVLRLRGPRRTKRIVAPAHALALARLDALLAEKLHERANRTFLKQYVSELSDVLRWYIEARFDIHAPEQTTPEFLEACRSRVEFNEDDVTTLERFMRQCDEVKFARADSTLAERLRGAETVRDFIDRTRRSDLVVDVKKSDAKRLGVRTRVLVERPELPSAGRIAA
ncbi:MAG: hypothetical protein AAGD00_05985 [Planctomycetota bacterium]